MKIFKLFVIAVAALAGFIACQKELDFDFSVPSTGTILKDASGNCMPAPVNGIYQKDTLLKTTNYIDVTVTVTAVGTYDIKSDTINGFSFREHGTFGTTGTKVIRLYGSGKPLAPGVNTFTITYGTSSCTVDVTVVGTGGGAAVYTLGGAPAACTGFTLGSGTYTAGQILVPANSAIATVNVTGPGTYDLTTNVVNGISFKAIGVFTTLGVNSVTLSGSGTPLAPGTFTYTLTSGSSTCTFTVTVVAGGTAVYTLGGNPGNCTGVTLAGVFKQGVSMSGSTVKVDVTVTTVGTYTAVVFANNGVSFSSAGTFTTLGPQQITLNGSGTPVVASSFNYIINGPTTNCTFAVTYDPASSPATFTLKGGPGNCAPIAINGTYTVGTPLNATNTVAVDVDVTVAGAYTITTGTNINGISFTASGVFPSTGSFTVTLNGSGTPTAATANTYAPAAGTSSCTFSITPNPGSTIPADHMYSFKVGATTYSGPLVGNVNTTDPIPPEEEIDAHDAVDPTKFQIAFNNTAGPINAGTYSGTATTGKFFTIEYVGAIQFVASPALFGFTDLSANISSINTTTHVVQGTFSGTAIDAGFNVVTVTNGTFKFAY